MFLSNRFTRRKEPPVSMQKLLSFGYADDWFSGRKDVKTTKEQNIGIVSELMILTKMMAMGNHIFVIRNFVVNVQELP